MIKPLSPSRAFNHVDANVPRRAYAQRLRTPMPGWHKLSASHSAITLLMMFAVVMLLPARAPAAGARIGIPATASVIGSAGVHASAAGTNPGTSATKPAAPMVISATHATTVLASTATITTPLNLKHVLNAALNFGTIAITGAGTVTVSPAGIATTTGGVTKLGGVPAADSFTLTGASSAGVTLALASTSLTLTGKVTGKTIAFTILLPGATQANSNGKVTLDPNGNGGFTVGGTLTLKGKEPADSYSGGYTITAQYQ